MRWTYSATLLALSVSATWGCGTNDAVLQDSVALNSDKPEVSTRREGEFVVETYDLDRDKEADVIKYFEEYPSPDDPSVTKRRLRTKKVDVDSNGSVNIVRRYDKDGLLTEEETDVDLDGTFDVHSYFDEGTLVRKEVLGGDGEVAVTRYYSDGDIIRVEKDRNDDGKIDYWEYYEEGTLTRIGTDINGDEKADDWTSR